MSQWLRRFKYTILALFLLLTMPVAVVFATGLQTIRSFEEDRPMQAAVIFDRNGTLIASLGETGQFVPLGEVPDHLTSALVAVEDSRFYEHRGIDWIGVARAFWVNLRQRRTVQGASTITQQLAKNIFLHPGRTAARKLEEFALAILLETRYSKDRIMELYLNQVYFGEGAYGVESASRTYFGKSVSDLSLAESTLLAGLPRAPSIYSPYRNPVRAVERRSVVLERMVATDRLSAAEAVRIRGQELALARRTGGQARYFVDWITSRLLNEFGESLVFQGGLRVHTSLDLDLQRTAEEIFAEQDHQGALVSLDAASGQVLAMVGGRNYIESQFNRAVHAKRQPGSAFKPIIYAAALRDGYQVNSIVEDIPRAYADYRPENYEEAYWGPVTMKHAIKLSLNNAAVWTLNEIGVANAFRYAQEVDLGLVSDDRHLALALGGLTKGVSPLQITAAFVPFANGGVFYPPDPIIRVVDHQGNVLKASDGPGRTVLTPDQAYLMTDMLMDVLETGTARHLQLDRPAAGKTGTTNEQIDLWFIGYTPQLVTGVYIGNDDREPLEGFGGTVAGPIWEEFMSAALADADPEEFPVPDNVVTGVQIDIFTGLLANDRCDWTEWDAFVDGTQPTRLAPCALPPQRGRPAPPRIPEPEPEWEPELVPEPEEPPPQEPDLEPEPEEPPPPKPVPEPDPEPDEPQPEPKPDPDPEFDEPQPDPAPERKEPNVDNKETRGTTSRVSTIA